MFQELLEMLSLPFVQKALIVGILISLCASILGVTLVLKRFSFIGDGLSHVAFIGLAIAAVVGLTNNMLIIMPVTIICAIFLLKGGSNNKMKGDSLIAVISVSALSLGYLIMNVFPASSNVSADVCNSLFGSILMLTLTDFDMWLCIVLSAVVLIVFVFMYNHMFAVTFDENFTKAIGVNTNFVNLVIAIVTAIVISLAMKLVGSLLISAIIVFPALSSMRIFKSFKSVTISSAIISVLSTVSGIIISLLANTPIGATIVLVNLVVFLMFVVAGFGLQFKRGE